jgi:hypothetical protein
VETKLINVIPYAWEEESGPHHLLCTRRRAARRQSIQLQDPRPHLWGRGRGEGVSLAWLTLDMNNDGGGI